MKFQFNCFFLPLASTPMRRSLAGAKRKLSLIEMEVDKCFFLFTFFIQFLGLRFLISSALRAELVWLILLKPLDGLKHCEKKGFVMNPTMEALKLDFLKSPFVSKPERAKRKKELSRRMGINLCVLRDLCLDGNNVMDRKEEGKREKAFLSRLFCLESFENPFRVLQTNLSCRCRRLGWFHLAVTIAWQRFSKRITSFVTNVQMELHRRSPFQPTSRCLNSSENFAFFLHQHESRHPPAIVPPCEWNVVELAWLQKTRKARIDDFSEIPGSSIPIWKQELVAGLFVGWKILHELPTRCGGAARNFKRIVSRNRYQRDEIPSARRPRTAGSESSRGSKPLIEGGFWVGKVCARFQHFTAILGCLCKACFASAVKFAACCTHNFLLCDSKSEIANRTKNKVCLWLFEVGWKFLPLFMLSSARGKFNFGKSSPSPQKSH